MLLYNVHITCLICCKEIPFPSVTVCPGSSSLWSGLRQFLNEKPFTPEYRSGRGMANKILITEICTIVGDFHLILIQ